MNFEKIRNLEKIGFALAVRHRFLEPALLRPLQPTNPLQPNSKAQYIIIYKCTLGMALGGGGREILYLEKN